MKFKKILALALCMMPLISCGAKNLTSSVSRAEESETVNMKTVKLTINGCKYEASFQDNETVEELKKNLPLTMTMTELNGNEYYKYLDFGLPVHEESVNSITEGDIMLWGDNCLVIFYDSFTTPYSYTRVGHVKNAEGLEENLKSGTVVLSLD